MKNKKALEVKALITMIILIVSFLVILILWSQINWGGNINKEACQSSIALRDSMNLGRFEFKEGVALKCRTERICLTDKLFGGCDNLKSTDNSPVRRVKVSDYKEIADSLADIIYEDYVMTGRGELNFMPRVFTSQDYCLFTSKITMDSKLVDKLKADKLTVYDLYKSMEGKKQDNGVSYFKEVYDADFSSLDSSQINKAKANIIALNSADVLVAVKISNRGWAGAFDIGAIGGVGAVGLLKLASFVIPGAMGVKVVTTVFFSVAGAGTYFSLPSGETGYQYYPPTLVPYTEKVIAELNCDSVETLA